MWRAVRLVGTLCPATSCPKMMDNSGAYGDDRGCGKGAKELRQCREQHGHADSPPAWTVRERRRASSAARRRHLRRTRSPKAIGSSTPAC